jgi:hypothetical protein
VRGSFSVEGIRSENAAKKLFASMPKPTVFSFVSLRSETLEIISETKTKEAKPFLKSSSNLGRYSDFHAYGVNDTHAQ